MEKEKYKTNKLTNFCIESLTWVFLIGIVLGIWLDNYRWKLIFTAIFSFFVCLLLDREEKFKKRTKEGEN